MFATIVGTGLLLLFTVAAGAGPAWWQILIATTIIGIAAGICFNSVFNTALGNLRPEEAGTASGSLSAIQQVANGIGSALVTTVFIGFIGDGVATAMTTTLVVILAIAAICLLAVPFLPRTAVALDD